MSPKRPFDEFDVPVPGARYGEFQLQAEDGARLAPFEASLFSIEPGHGTPRDEHAERECWLVVSGTGRLTYGGQTMDIAKGELLFFESHTYHFVVNTGTEVLTIFSTWWPA